MDPWAQKILSGDLRAVARAASAIENRRPEAEPLLKELFPHTGKATIVGVPGSPGAGKSTLVDQLIHELRPAGNQGMGGRTRRRNHRPGWAARRRGQGRGAGGNRWRRSG